MNGAELRTAVRDLIGEDTAAAFSDALILRQVNLAYREIYAEIVENNENFFATTALIDYVNGTERYTLPDADKILRVEFTTALGIPADKRAVWIDLALRDDYVGQVGSSVVAEDFRRVYLFGNTIGVVPVPTSTVTGALRVYYAPPATDLTAGTSPPTEWKADYQEVIVWGALMRLLRRDKESMAEISPTYNRLRKLTLGAFSQRETQQPQQIVDLYGV